MNLLENIKGKSTALLGAGITNMPLAAFLAERGAILSVRDRKTEEELGERAARLRALGAKLILGEDYLSDLHEDVIFRSPGIRPDIPPLVSATAAGKILTSEMELFLSLRLCPVYAVTGSDGKSTTTTLISLMLRQALGDERVFLGGNIGEPLLHRSPMIRPDSAVAVELSSFQLMTIDAPVRTATITNITPNHLNWHTGMDEYIEAKKRILRRAERAILNYDNEITREIGLSLRETPTTFFSKNPVPAAALKPTDAAVYLEDGEIRFLPAPGKPVRRLFSASDIRLPGMHNVENYMAAAAATIDVVSPEQMREVAVSFGGVRHRLELVREKDGVSFYNSSIDSSPTRTAAALSALGDRPIVVICGGYDKKIPFEPLAEAILSRKNVRAMVLTGATADKIATVMENSPLFDARRAEGFQMLREPSFDAATLLAAATAKTGDVVLLSPACASFDAFPNFEARGERFRELIRAL